MPSTTTKATITGFFYPTTTVSTILVMLKFNIVYEYLFSIHSKPDNDIMNASFISIEIVNIYA